MIPYNKYLVAILSVLLLCIQPIHADIGPKPSVTIEFKGLENQTYYATLLSKYEYNGPNAVYDGTNARYTMSDEEYRIWQAMVHYEDQDGFFFLQEIWDCTQTQSFRWGYYPPDPFKVLIYLPDMEQFIVSEIYERYAFDSYYTVTVAEDMTVIPQVSKSYDYTLEIGSLGIRIVLTILLELLIAFLFKIKDIRFIVIVNLITQVLLNVALNIVNFYQGQYAFIFYYFLLEILVILIESILYSKRFSKKQGIPYAICANTFSLGFGLWLAQILPGIF